MKFFLIILLSGCAFFPSGIYHRVQKGETLWRISRVYEVDLDELARINHLADATKIRAGQMIFIPGAKERKDTLAYVPKRPSPERKEEAKPPPELIDFSWPLQGEILTGFGKQSGKRHQGLDIAGKEGVPIVAIYGGIVTYSDNKLRGYGNMVIVKHNEDYSSVYAHNSINLVKEGERVNKGQAIAQVGATGWAEVPHLHFEIRERGKAVNPVFYLP
ncbi:peptidoglycan DD-metalloendopeptidase family protein [bacterium]|nr:peptidoglycan DD-metalloendopeptidase family protein [bacterium]NIO19038.1 peptidoglycan DD-metalloendopeptidase family protein [bacterium]NIO74167.1 peptidoglycan DD-metalloendopeptidase family protein [bacterium]